MPPTSPLPPEVWKTLPVEAEALIGARRPRIEAMQRRVDSLQKQVRSLRVNSRTSSRPPSTDPIHLKRQPPEPPSGGERGGQPGHKRATRPLAPPERLAGTVTRKPAACAGCGADLDGSDPKPIRHRVAEVPPVRPVVVEHRVHRLTRPGCGATTRGPLPEGVPCGSFGPRPRARLGLLAAEPRRARRPAPRPAGTLLGLDIPPGVIARLERRTATMLGPVDAELAEAVRLDPWAHIDETPWRRADRRARLWVARTDRATPPRIGARRDAATARSIRGDDPSKVVICDRFSARGRVEKERWCWAHLRGDLQAMIDRHDGGSATGRALLEPSDGLSRGWHRVADGELGWDDLLRWAGSIRVRVHEGPGRGASGPSPGTAATCRHLPGGCEPLWRLLAGDGVEPTNDTAERAPRHGVPWRKSSGGTAGEGGSRFVSRLPGVAETCRQQGHSVPDLLASCFEATPPSPPVPSLLRPRTSSPASWAEDAP